MAAFLLGLLQQVLSQSFSASQFAAVFEEAGGQTTIGAATRPSSTGYCVVL